MNETPPAPSDLSKLAIDIGPVIIFILTLVVTKNPFTATGVFMAAMAAAMLFEKMRFGKISAMLILSGMMVIVFGGLTIYLHDQKFIQMKPTIYYALVAGILFYGGYSRRPLLKHALGVAYPELSDRGWHVLGRNFAWFFLAMALANEFIRHQFSFEFWGWSKLWLFVPATMLFGVANIPLIMRHSEGGHG
jgi:intracellular septation protein